LQPAVVLVRLNAMAKRAGDGGEILAELKAAGLRRTDPRMAVLTKLAALAMPISHGELADALQRFGYDRATIYRNLIHLVDAGLVARSDRGDHVWRFSLVRRGEGDHGRRHPHLLCSDCNAVVCLPDVKVSITPDRRHRRVAGMEVQLKGRCDRCDRP